MPILLRFSVNGVHCAIAVGKTTFVERIVWIMPSPGGPAGAAGVIDLHGRIVPVYEVRATFGFPCRKPALSDVLIVTKAGPDCVALWVDATSGISTDLCPPGESSPSEEERPVFEGVNITPDGLYIIRDLQCFLRDARPAQIQAELQKNPVVYEESAGEEDPARVLETLMERASKLAQPAAKAPVIVRIEVLKFHLAFQEYAIGMKYVREVVLSGGITPVPGTPEYISGVCAVRGEIISLVDLRVLFSIREHGLTDLNRVIVVTDGSMTFGLLADYITGIGSIPWAIPNSSDPVPYGITAPYLLGVVDNVVVLDCGALLADPKMLIDDQTS